jgi:hypothetical protein
MASGNHTFGTTTISQSASMARITTAAAEWVERQLSAANTP